MRRNAVSASLGVLLAAALLAPPPAAQDAERRRGFSVEITNPAEQGDRPRKDPDRRQGEDRPAGGAWTAWSSWSATS